MDSSDNLKFDIRPIDAVAIRPGKGPNIQVSKAIIQRTAALRAYNSFALAKDWMEKLSAAYVVALATRSADSWLMQDIQNQINVDPPITCAKCREATLGVNVIRERMFPDLKKLRKHANDLIHHLDDPKNKGISTLNLKGVFDYCYHLFQEGAGYLFGEIPDGTFPLTLCKACKAKSKKGGKSAAAS